jgi:hypothetical protein
MEMPEMLVEDQPGGFKRRLNVILILGVKKVKKGKKGKKGKKEKGDDKLKDELDTRCYVYDKYGRFIVLLRTDENRFEPVIKLRHIPNRDMNKIPYYIHNRNDGLIGVLLEQCSPDSISELAGRNEETPVMEAVKDVEKSESENFASED